MEQRRRWWPRVREKHIEDEIRRIAARSQDMENNLLAERKKESDEDANNFKLVFICLLALITIVLIAVFIMITTNLRALKKAEQESANKKLDTHGKFPAK